ncbi:putative endo-polygalacturonase [Helianthus annuus]|nr:putative endo-polygalacturonase [Helianthus annuus]
MGGSGSVQGVTFSNIQVSKVETPIIIDQYYCDGGKCQNKSSSVALSDISYENIRGTYTRNPVRLACSESTPCTDVNLDTIQLQPLQQNEEIGKPFCSNAYGELKTSTTPPIDCLMASKPSEKQSRNNYDICQN